jgi:hypothetical protein
MAARLLCCGIFAALVIHFECVRRVTRGADKALEASFRTP